jgi:hypothetical protein
VFKPLIEKEIPVKSAESSVILYDLAPVIGVDTLGRYITENITSWFLKVNFPDTYCVDKVLSLKGNVETHSWECTEKGCATKHCKGSRCKDLVVSVLNEDPQEKDLPANCGNAVKISIPEADGRMMDFDYFGISEIAVIGQLYEVMTPTTESSLENLCVGLGMLLFITLSRIYFLLIYLIFLNLTIETINHNSSY